MVFIFKIVIDGPKAVNNGAGSFGQIFLSSKDQYNPLNAQYAIKLMIGNPSNLY